jgi:polyisoprenoid-binding protein YceI
MSMKRAKFVAALIGVLAVATPCARAQTHEINVEKSVLTVRVYKTGLFSAFAHDHEIHAPIESGSFDAQKRAVEFKVKSADLKVIDPGVSQGDRDQVQATMVGPKVLDTAHFPEIAFHSMSIEPKGPDQWSVQGELSLHGQTHPISVEVNGANGHYRGSTRFRQTEFGIAPVSIAGGSIKVKDEVKIEFEIVGK